MKSILHLPCILLLLCILWPTKLIATPAKHAPLPAVPAYIEENKRNREVVFNNAKYDRNAKVYYLYNVNYISYSYDLDHYTNFLAPVSRKIYRKGADLIVHISLSDSEIEELRKYHDYGNIERQAKSCRVKSPIVNSFKAVTRRTLFKRSDGTTYSYAPSGLRAIDADGKPLAYFTQRGDTIVMYDYKTNSEKVIIESKFSESTWEAEAILATYKELIAQVEGETAASQPADDEAKDEEEPDKPRKKEEKARKKASEKKQAPRWKKVKVES